MSIFASKSRRWFLIASIGSALLIVWHWPLAANRGRLSARLDIAIGRPQILTYGIVTPTHNEYARLLKDRYGIKTRAVAGCIVSSSLVTYVSSYNEETRTAELNRFGHDIFTETREQADANVQREIAEGKIY